MDITPFMLSIQKKQHAIGDAVERLAQQTDMKQYPMVGVELGRIQEMAQAILDIIPHAQDALWRDSQK